MTNQNENQITPIFKTHSIQNEAKSREAGRPIYDDIEVVEIRIAGNNRNAGVFPAHDIWRTVPRPDGTREPETYALRWPEQYRKFKSNLSQDHSGTPLSEAPFLTQGKRLSLKAINIHTVEALAGVEGQSLKMLGMGGRELKDQARAYLEKASGSAVETRLAAENASLLRQIEELRSEFATLRSGILPTAVDTPAVEDEADRTPSPFDDWEDSDIKDWLEANDGRRPKGNPSHATLVRLADEAKAEIALKG